MVIFMAGTLKPSKLRAMKKTHPKFFRQNAGRGTRKRIKEGWKRPRGVDNKKREKVKTFGAEPTIGYRNPKAIRGMHPCGRMEVRVHNEAMLALIPQDAAVRIAAGVGGRMRERIRAKGKELKLKLVN